MKFSKRLDLFGDEIFAALNERRLELEKQGKKIYNMSVGTPDFHTPDHIKKALMDAAADDQNWRYSLRDLPELLDAVCAYYKKRFQVDITPDMVMSVYGSQEGMGHLGMTCVMREMWCFFRIPAIRFLQREASWAAQCLTTIRWLQSMISCLM